MRLFNSGKKKIVAGTIAVSLVAGGGIGLAQTDFGGQLQSWYQSQFDTNAAETKQNVTKYGENKADDLYGQYKKGEIAVTGELNKKGENEINKVGSEIESQQEEYSKEINKTKQELQEELDGKFDMLFTVGETLINKYAEQGYSQASDSMTNHAEQQGENATDNVEEQLGEVKDDAVDELETTIESAKKELRSDLNDGSDELTSDLKNHIDDKADKLKSKAVTLVQKLLNDQKQAITDVAGEEKQKAFDELDAVVDSINQ